jgi:hypothetical protein
MLETIQSRVILRIDDALSDEEFNEWARLIKEGNNQATSSFLQSKNVNVPDLMAEEALKYKTEVVSYINYMKQSGKKMDEVIKFVNNSKTSE